MRALVSYSKLYKQLYLLSLVSAKSGVVVRILIPALVVVFISETSALNIYRLKVIHLNSGFSA